VKALTWQGNENVQLTDVADPQIQAPTDAIIRVTSTAICGSDLHLYDGFIPTMMSGDILGHEFMGEVSSSAAT
jgi:threonine dehydrogenase-like Zn-dependent dehydrogenase